jgi:ABC-type uncharacterized transport system, permease component
MSKRSEKIRGLLVPLIAVILGLILGGIIMLAFGYNPIMGYQKMFATAFLNPQTQALNPKSIGEIFVTAAPLIFTALGFAIANTAGFFNIGLSGQALCGWVASVWVALSMPDAPKIVVLTVAILAGVLSGAVAAAIPGILRAFFGTSEVIVTIMMNYILLHVSTHLVTYTMSDDIKSSKVITTMVGENGSLRTHFLTNITDGSRLNLGIIFALIFLVVMWFVMKKTTLGYQIRAVGLNSFASEYAGMNSKQVIVTSMIISGALAGMGGVILGLGTFGNFAAQGASISIGFDGMAVSLLGGGSSIGILLSALLFSILKLGGAGMQFAGIPSELVDIDIAIIIFFVAISFVIHFVLAKFFGTKKEVEDIEEESKVKNEEQQEGGTL